jgi:hypothetical protein
MTPDLQQSNGRRRIWAPVASVLPTLASSFDMTNDGRIFVQRLLTTGGEKDARTLLDLDPPATDGQLRPCLVAIKLVKGNLSHFAWSRRCLPRKNLAGVEIL